MLRIRLRFFLLLFSCFLAGCANYATRIREPRRNIEAGNYELAIEQLKKLCEKKDNDELLFLMDLGIAFHRAGRYPEAIEVFLKADKLAEIKDYTSISEEAASVLMSDEVKPYKGEDFEKILINVYLALDFTLSGKWESALVESRRVNHKLDLMISEGRLPYERNAFAKYLAALLFEAQREYNDAFVDYQQLFKWRGEMPFLGLGLLRLSSKLGAEQEFDIYQKRFSSVRDFRLDKGHGEIVLLLEQGKVPIKVENPAFRLLPIFQRRFYQSDHVELRVSGSSLSVDSAPYYDIESTAIKELEGRTAAIMAKKIGGLVAKEIVAQQVAKQTKSELLGALTKIFLYASDQADLRSWSTLPARMHVARITVPAGRHDVILDMVTLSGSKFREIHKWSGVEVGSGKMVFLNYRTTD